MAYSTEQMAKELKTAREAKGLSQRALSELVRMPQSHISKIERGGVDLRLSSLIEIARALDLEVTLIPRRNLSAVRSITRSRPSVMQEMEVAAKASRELRRLQKTIAKISRENPAMKEIAQFQRRVNDLTRLKIPASALEALMKVNDSLKPPIVATDTLSKITESLNRVQHLRNELVHRQVDFFDIEKIRPAYSLEDDDYG